MPVHVLKTRGASSSGYRLVAKNGEVTIYLYGVIDSAAGFFGDGVTARMVADDLKKAGKASSITVRINSPGGDVFEGRAIYSLLREQGAKSKINVIVDGEAASIASIIAMAGDTIAMADGSMMMIHRAWTGLYGNCNKFREMADLLDTIDSTLIDTYAARTKQSVADITKWMDAETWMTAKEAVTRGFADEMIAPHAIAAMAVDRSKLGHTHVPKTLLRPNLAAAAAAVAAMKS